MKKVLAFMGKLCLLAILIFSLTLPVALVMPGRPAMLVQAFVLVLAPTALYGVFERKRKWPLGIRQPDWLSKWGSGLLAGAGLITAVFALIRISGGVRVAGVKPDALMQGEAWPLLVLFLLAAVSEEWLVRGYVQGLLADAFSRWTARIGSALFFALLHGLNPGIWEAALPMINLVLAGAFLAMYRERSGGIWAPAGFHFAWNLLQGPVYGFRVSGHSFDSLLTLESSAPDWLSGGAFGAEGSLACTALLFLGMVFMLSKPGETQG